MLRKICPVCEQVMKSDHYCKVCRRFVKSPYVRDITYYLNESHPAGETNCEYHGRPGEWQRPNYGHRQPQAQRQGTGERTGKGNGVSPVKGMAIGLIVFLIMIQILAVMFLVVRYRSVREEQVSGAVMEADNEFRELEEEEVKAVGQRCNGAGHFSVHHNEMEQELEQMIEDVGYEVESEEVYSDNSTYGSGSDVWTRYSTEKYYYLDSPEGNSSNVIVLEWDTATEELHEINLYLTETDRAVSLTGQLFRALSEAGELPADEYYETRLEDEILAYLEQDEISDGCWYEFPWEEGGVDLYVNGEYDEIYISISKTY